MDERFFTFQYSQEMNFKEVKRSTEWVKRLPGVLLNSEETRLTGKRPVDAIKEKVFDEKSTTTYSRPIGLREKRLDSSKNVQYLYATCELDGGQRRATDPIWSLKIYNIENSLVNKGELVLYHPKDGPKRGFIREELQIFPPGTELPPEGIC